MRGPSEDYKDFDDRRRRAVAVANDKAGGPYKNVPISLVGAFFAGSFPAYCALLAAGYNGDRLQIPLICAGLATAAIAYLLIWERNKAWNKAYEQHLEATKPRE